MRILENENLCCGCGACYNSCQKDAIEMIQNEEGFYYPVINETACVNCGVCRNVCPIMKELPKSDNIIMAMKHNNNEIRSHSASGGAFTLFSDAFLRKKGIVYGVAYDDMFKAKHIRAENIDGRDRMRGSKYVQSLSYGIYPQVKKDLTDNKQVLFCGTPCQVAGLLCYLKKSYENLTTIDIICHGVMSPKVFEDYIHYVNKKYGTIKQFTFRDKKIAWRGCHISVVTQDKTITETVSLNVARQLYYGHYATRPSCHSCHFTSINRVSDITIGDFWGIENSNPSFEDALGVSLIIVNTSKGKALWNDCKNSCSYIEEKLEHCKQPQLYKSATPNPRRAQFWNDYKKFGFKRIAKTYGETGFVAQSKKHIKSILKK